MALERPHQKIERNDGWPKLHHPGENEEALGLQTEEVSQ
jgi:hypothetical protein